MKINKFILFFLIILSSLLLYSCSEENKDPIKFVILSTGDDFSGLYGVNGNFLTEYSIAGMPASSDTYTFQKVLEDVDSLYIKVTFKTADVAASLSVLIYRDDKKVAERSLNVTTTTLIRSLIVQYEYDSGDTSGEATSSKDL